MSTTLPTIVTTINDEFGAPEINKIFFSWFDYAIFAVMLGLSAAIGVYFGFFGKKQDNVAEYLLAGKTMNTWPIAISLVAGEISDTTVLSADIYTYGASYWISSIAMIFAATLTSMVFLPVFFKLQLTSSYEYLTHRFDEKARLLSSFLFVFSMLTYMPIIVFVPALAFNQATGINVHWITPIVCFVCIFYTTIGGLKAVVWTDTLQFTIMTATLCVVLFLGFKATGSVEYIFQKGYDGGRLNLFDMDPDPTRRTTFWSVIIGTGTGWGFYMSCSQNCIQKFMAVPTLGDAKKAISIFVFCVFVFNSFSIITGLIIYAKYSDCDPVTTKRVKQADQLVPYFIMDVAGDMPGLPGFFIAGSFCGALSSLSAALNTLAGVVYVNFIKPYLHENTTEKRASDIMKCLVVIIGLASTGMVFIVEHLGSIFTLAISLGGMIDGPMFGMFALGMLVPFANTKGALTGAIGGLTFISWILFGSQYHTAQGAIHTPILPTSTDSCNFTYFNNLTSDTLSSVEPYTAPWVYRISFYYYSLIGSSVTIIIGIIVSLLTGGRDQKVNRDLLSPVIYSLLPKDEISSNEIMSVVKNNLLHHSRTNDPFDNNKIITSTKYVPRTELHLSVFTITVLDAGVWILARANIVYASPLFIAKF